MKKLITKKTLLLLMLGLFISIGAKAQDVTGVELNHDDTLVLSIGEKATLIATVIPAEVTDVTVVWKNEYTDIITIDTVTTTDKKHCIVEAVKEGEGKVIVRTTGGVIKRDTCVIKVVIPVEGVEIKGEKDLELFLGKDTVLNAKLEPSDPTDPSIIWESRDPSIIDIVTEEEERTGLNCKIRPLRPGTTQIYAKTVDGEFEDYCEITVKSADIESFSLNFSAKTKDTLKMYVGEDTTVIAQIRPEEGTYKFVYWDYADNVGDDIIDILAEDNDTICYVKAKGVGIAKIVVESFDREEKDTCVVEVKGIKVDTMYMKVDTIYLDNKDNKKAELIATVGPNNASDKSINWRSDNPLVVAITSVEKDTVCHIETGYSGEAYIYAETSDKRFKDSCYVKVIVPVDSVVLRVEIFDEEEDDFIEGEIKDVDGYNYVKVIEGINLVTDSVARLIAKVYPDSATKSAYEPLTWLHFDPNLMRVDLISDDSICYVTALRSGVDTMRVKTKNDTISHYYMIDIPFRNVDDIEISVDENIVDKDTIFLNVSDSYELTTTVYPWNATNDTLTWEITGEADVIKVDSVENNVFLNALKQGNTILYAKATDGTQAKDSFIVKVRNIPVASLSLNRDTIRIYENNVDSVLATFTPVTATNKSVTWSSSKNDVVQITSAGTDTVCTFKGLKADTALIRAVSIENGVAKDSCVVIVQEQFAFVDSVSSQGLISLSLKLPDDITLTGSFELQLPKDFGLTLKSDGGYKTELEAPYKESSDLQIVEINDSTYTFNITLKASPTNGLLRAAATKKKVMDIAYTIFNNDLENSTAVYDVKFVNVDFNLIDSDENVTKIKEDHTAKIKVFKDHTGNELIESQQLNAYITGHRLYVNSAKAETVYVYSLNGALLFSKDKAEGQAVFNLDTQEKVLIIRGSSGWTQKTANR